MLRTGLQPLVLDPTLDKPYNLFQGENSYAEVQVIGLEGIEGKLSVDVYLPYKGFLSI